MSSKDKIEEATQELDTTVGKKAAGSESSTYPGVLNFNDYNGKSSTNSRTPTAYKSVIQDSMKKLGNDYSSERRADSMEDNKLLEIYMEKVDKDQREIKEDMRERESRISKQISDSEARESNRMDRIEQLITSQNDKIDLLRDKVGEQLESDKKYRHTNNIAIVMGVIATVIAMIGIYFATISTITDLISITVK